MNKNKKSISELIIPAFAPYFLEKPVFWFRKHKRSIKRAYKNKQQFWKDNVTLIGQHQTIHLSELLRTLNDLGYEKTQRISRPGEFSLTGGVLHIFPIGTQTAFTVEFLGNTIEEIRSHAIDYSETDTKKELQRRLDKESLKILMPGDYLVHLDHGIGRFLQIDASDTNEYYVLEYAAGDRLLIPLGLEKKLSRYIGFTEPKISRLGSPLWDRIKRKVKEDTVKTAKELLALYAKREISVRAPYTPDSPIEHEITSSFPFQETPDQETAIEEVRGDLTKSEKPMDRIVCGDVGFGKTEVALRASVAVASGGYQVAILTPTTILGDQHYHTFKERLGNLPIEIALLSRLQSRDMQRRILEKLEQGLIDIIIGTHRLLSRDVKFKRLGLLIIDEEQKFGVKQKEKFKELRSGLDILSLSATPIPRTLYLALSSLRNISVIQTPPPNRLPVKTFVMPWNKEIIKNAARRELARKGQIYYLHNRIETIEMARREIQKIVPRARIGIAHGRLSETGLMQIMHDLRERKIDILIATTIIENGLDLPNINTLIVADATRLGLAQAYQIRGRIGRSHAQAYAYFLYPSRHTLPEKASQRLDALKEAQALGSGYQIALRDLEIRGAGNILGKEQSGSINKVGLNLYCQMLNEATEELRSNGRRG